jgi:hypothetical protein
MHTCFKHESPGGDGCTHSTPPQSPHPINYHTLVRGSKDPMPNTTAQTSPRPSNLKTQEHIPTHPEPARAGHGTTQHTTFLQSDRHALIMKYTCAISSPNRIPTYLLCNLYIITKSLPSHPSIHTTYTTTIKVSMFSPESESQPFSHPNRAIPTMPRHEV